jgi:hypothetical protein
MNTNDFSKCDVGTKLWDHVRGCEGTVERNEINENEILVKSNGNGYWFKKLQNPIKQKLFFGKPEIIAPPEPVRLPDYKKGEWIAVWDYGYSGPFIRQFKSYSKNGRVNTTDGIYSGFTWDNHCAIAELPEVLAKWGEK